MEAWNNPLGKADKTEQGFALSIFPVNSNKVPFGPWKHNQFTTAPIDDWLNNYQNQSTVSIIAGSPTKHLPNSKVSTSTVHKENNAINCVKSFSSSAPAINDLNNKYSNADLFLNDDWLFEIEDDEKVCLKMEGDLPNFQLIKLNDSSNDYNQEMELL